MTKIGVAIIAMLFIHCHAYGAITVDSYLGDWGVTPGPYGASDWVPNSGIYYTVEDQINDYLVPGYGGQLFDVEAIYMTKEGSNYFFAIVTGFPSYGAWGWIPGDIALDPDNDGVYEFGLKTYNANAGKFYKDLTMASWDGGWWGWGGVSDPATIKDGFGTYVGTVDFKYLQTYYDATGADPTNNHWVIEAKVPENYFDYDSWVGGGKVHWTMTCGNDALDLNVPRIPEPSSILLLGMGLAGLIRMRKRFNKTRIASPEGAKQSLFDKEIASSAFGLLAMTKGCKFTNERR